MKHSILMVFAFGLLFSCATPYESASVHSGGYSETQLNETMYKVNFRGNGATPVERAEDFALLRCAELTLERGYPYFAIIDIRNLSTEGTYTQPVTTRTTIKTKEGKKEKEVVTTTSGGTTYQYLHPATSNTIVLLREKPENGVVFDAAFIYRQLRDKYELYHLVAP